MKQFVYIVLLLPFFALAQKNNSRNQPGVAVPDDSPAAREAALARLRSAVPRPPCEDASTMSRTYGTICNSREFPAPPILAAPKKVWEINPGWWGVWQPFLVGNLVLTGSCNNDGNEGLSALDKNTGKIVWRIGNICAVGNRRGSQGFVSFHELPSGEVLLIYPRNNNEPTDFYVINVKTGRIARALKPLKTGPVRNHGGGVFTVLNQSTKDNQSYITALGPDMGRILWQNTDFQLAMTDKLDPQYQPTFSYPAVSNGILFQTARSKDQPEPATRQLHAIDLQTGKTLWRHKEQPVTNQNSKISYRSDDGVPMVADGKVIIKVHGLDGPVTVGDYPYGEGLRALDMRTGKILWTTAAISKQEIFTRVAAGNILVTEVLTNNERELLGYRLTDGRLAWRRPIAKRARLMAASGGAFYTGERIVDENDKWKENRLQGFDGETGTLLWTASLPDHYLGVGSDSWDPEKNRSGAPSWTIDRDGAIYGVTLKGAFKLK